MSHVHLAGLQRRSGPHAVSCWQLLLPLLLLGWWLGLWSPAVASVLLAGQALLLVVLALRKFPMPEEADLGDLSVFAKLAGELS